MTGEELMLQAMQLINYTDPRGEIDRSQTAEQWHRGLMLVNTLLADVMPIEGKQLQRMTRLEDTLPVCDHTAMAVMPYGLAHAAGAKRGRRRQPAADGPPYTTKSGAASAVRAAGWRMPSVAGGMRRATMERKWSDPEQIAEEYRRGINFKAGLGQIGLYAQAKKNERFFCGDQWHGAKCGDRPLLQHNVIKRIGDYKMAVVGSASIAVSYSADGVPFTEASRHTIEQERELLTQDAAAAESRLAAMSESDRINLINGGAERLFPHDGGTTEI